MIDFLRRELKKVVWVKSLYDKFRSASICLALYQQKLSIGLLESIIPDISDQYNTSNLDYEYIQLKVRAVHAFQIGLVRRVVPGDCHITDIGDSSGNHLTYIKALFPGVSSVSVNIDRTAVDKIESKGHYAVCLSAEDWVQLTTHSTDIVIMFQTLEHLENQIEFLRKAKRSFYRLRYMIITVPYVKKSRVGMHHLRDSLNPFWKGTPEDVHTFELCPEDLKLLCEYTGWEVEYERIYYQYPRYIPVVSWLLKHYWRRFDFEGFYGIVLRKKEI